MAWARDVIRQCEGTSCAPFLKQLGAKPYQSPRHDGATGYEIRLRDKKGADPAEWPEDLRVRQWPTVPAEAAR